MRRSINSSKLTKKTILEKVSQVSIFSAYLNLPNNVIQDCIDTGNLICSPIREDIHPTCGFRYDNRGKLKFRDFSGFFWGDCFDIVAYVMSTIYNKQYDISNKNDFIKVLRHITFTFKDVFYGQEKDIALINDINIAIESIKHKKNNIELVVRNWNETDTAYWSQFGVSIAYLNINFVYPVEQYYINRNINPEPKYYYNAKDVCYAYLLGKDRTGINNIKLYFPNRTKSCTRFITNCNHLEGIYNLTRNNYDIIVITKSTKDRLSLGAAIYNNAFLYGESNLAIGVINVPHETYRLRQNEYDWLSSKLNTDGFIVSLMDNDKTGMREAIWLRNNYNITPVIIPISYGIKDFAELAYKYDSNTIHNIIDITIKHIIKYEESNRCKRYSSERYDTLPY